MNLPSQTPSQTSREVGELSKINLERLSQQMKIWSVDDRQYLRTILKVNSAYAAVLTYQEYMSCQNG